MLIWHKYPDEIPTTHDIIILRTDEDTYKIGKYLNGHFDTYFVITHWAEFDKPIIDEEEVVVKKRGRPKKS